MSRDGYLPPGVEYGDLPGNRPEDAEWEDLHNWIDEYADDKGLYPEDVRRAVLTAQDAKESLELARLAFRANEANLLREDKELALVLRASGFDTVGGLLYEADRQVRELLFLLEAPDAK